MAPLAVFGELMAYLSRRGLGDDPMLITETPPQFAPVVPESLDVAKTVLTSSWTPVNSQARAQASRQFGVSDFLKANASLVYIGVGFAFLLALMKGRR